MTCNGHIGYLWPENTESEITECGPHCPGIKGHCPCRYCHRARHHCDNGSAYVFFTGQWVKLFSVQPEYGRSRSICQACGHPGTSHVFHGAAVPYVPAICREDCVCGYYAPERPAQERSSREDRHDRTGEREAMTREDETCLMKVADAAREASARLPRGFRWERGQILAAAVRAMGYADPIALIPAINRAARTGSLSEKMTATGCAAAARRRVDRLAAELGIPWVDIAGCWAEARIGEAVAAGAREAGES